jgi:hypothetical protein
MSTQIQQLKVRIIDCLMDEEIGDTLPNERLGCFVQYKEKFVDAIMIQEGAQMIKPDSITFPLEDGATEDPRIVLIVKDIVNDEPYAGSISIPRTVFLEGNAGQVYTQWITLFDDQGDDEYDGALGVQDDEEPRIRVEFTVSPVVVQQPKVQGEGRKSAKDRKAAASNDPSQPSYMQPIHNTKGGDKSMDKSRVESERKFDKERKSEPERKSAQGIRNSVTANKNSTTPDKILAKKDSQNNNKTKLTSYSGEGPRQMTKVVEIQKVLDANNDKRQNVQFLKSLLDSQLNSLISNLSYM